MKRRDMAESIKMRSNEPKDTSKSGQQKKVQKEL